MLLTGNLDLDLVPPWCTDRSGWRRGVRSGRGAAPPTIPGPLPCRSRPTPTGSSLDSA
jgi:hypothetical protein